MHEVDSWFDLDVRIDEPARRRQGRGANSYTIDITINAAMTISPALAAQADEVGRPRC